MNFREYVYSLGWVGGVLSLLIYALDAFALSCVITEK